MLYVVLKFFSTNASSSNGVLSLSASRFLNFLEILLSSLWAATPDRHTGLAAKNIVLCRQQLRLSDNFQRLCFVIRAFVCTSYFEAAQQTFLRSEKEKMRQAVNGSTNGFDRVALTTESSTFDGVYRPFLL
jgi:hypothetical protein